MLAILILSASSFVAAVDMPLASGSPADDSQNINYTNDNSPDGILYWNFLESLYVATQTGDGADQRILAPGMTENSDDDWLFDYFVNQYLLINEKSRDIKRQILACDQSDDQSNDQSQTAGFFEMIDALDQVEIAVYNLHLAVSSAKLMAGRQFELLAAIRNSPSRFSKTFLSKSHVYAGHEALAPQMVNTLCKAYSQGFDHQVETTDSE